MEVLIHSNKRSLDYAGSSHNNNMHKSLRHDALENVSQSPLIKIDSVNISRDSKLHVLSASALSSLFGSRRPDLFTENPSSSNLKLLRVKSSEDIAFMSHRDQSQPVVTQRSNQKSLGPIRNGKNVKVDSKSYRQSSIPTVASNRQIQEGRANMDEEVVIETFHEKFQQKYDHFKKMRKANSTHYFGKLKEVSNSKSKANRIILKPEQTVMECSTKFNPGLYVQQENTSIIEKKAKEVIRMKRKVLDGETIDVSKFYRDSDTKSVVHKVNEQVEDNVNTMQSHVQRNLKTPYNIGKDSVWTQTFSNYKSCGEVKEIKTTYGKSFSELAQSNNSKSTKTFLQKLGRSNKEKSSLTPLNKIFLLNESSPNSPKFDMNTYDKPYLDLHSPKKTLTSFRQNELSGTVNKSTKDLHYFEINGEVASKYQRETSQERSPSYNRQTERKNSNSKALKDKKMSEFSDSAKTKSYQTQNEKSLSPSRQTEQEKSSKNTARDVSNYEGEREELKTIFSSKDINFDKKLESNPPEYQIRKTHKKVSSYSNFALPTEEAFAQRANTKKVFLKDLNNGFVKTLKRGATMNILESKKSINLDDSSDFKLEGWNDDELDHMNFSGSDHDKDRSVLIDITKPERACLRN